MNNNDLVTKLWKMCDTLRDGGVSYQNYVNELATLLFLKMCEETGQEDDLLPEGMRWGDLKGETGLEQLQFYRRLLVDLGADKKLAEDEDEDEDGKKLADNEKKSNTQHAIVRAIFQNVNTTITNASQLTELVDTMNKLEWYQGGGERGRDSFGDMYEGLLEKNANETKSGAGQYFTPRALIRVMVKLMQPQPRERIQDPAAGTAGFLIEADKYIKRHTNDLDDLDDDGQDFQVQRAFVGLELVPETRRLALMNCLLHDIEGDISAGGAIRLGNTLGQDGEQLSTADVILTNPPFGSASSSNITRTFVYPSSNKQLCFMQHIYNSLEAGGRAAVVIPDNVLFEAGVGTQIRADLMDKCTLHTILRLPTGIFYAAGVKTNVLFFHKGTIANPEQDKGCTEETWVFDLRTNMQTFGKRSPFSERYLADFVACYGEDARGQSAREEGVYQILGCTSGEEVEQVLENARWRKFSRDFIREKGDSLDITWLKDNSITDAASLPEPEVLATEAMTELTEALREMNQLMLELGAVEQAEGQVALLAEEFGLEKKVVGGEG